MSFLKLFINHNQQGSFVNRLRRKRFAALEKRIEDLAHDTDTFKILDIGGDIAYWKNIGWKNNKSQIYLLNLYPNIIEEEDSNHFLSLVGNALEMPFVKGEFDLVFSNSVIEHVGNYKNQVKFAEAIKQLSNKYIIQTPSIWFPLEPHSLIPFFQFIPHRLRALLIMTFNINYFPKKNNFTEALEVSYSTLMFTKKRFSKLFPEAEIHVERILGIPKSYTAVRL